MNKKKYINDDGLFLQALLTIIVIIMAFISLFIPVLLLITEAFLALDLLVTAHNNSYNYGRKHMSFLYTLIGLMILGIVIYNYVMVFV